MEQTRILVVDDELVIRESLSGWLKRDGYHVDTVASGEEALDLLKTQSFDILLLDIQLDGITGMEVLTQVKEAYPDIDAIMITALGSIPSAVQAMKSHAFDYILKPFDPDELEVIIQKLVKPFPAKGWWPNSFQQPGQGWPLCQCELRCHSQTHHGKRVVRPSKRRIYRCQGNKERPPGTGCWGNSFPGWNR